MVKIYHVIGKLFPLFGEFFTFLLVGVGVKNGIYWQKKVKIGSFCNILY